MTLFTKMFALQQRDGFFHSSRGFMISCVSDLEEVYLDLKTS